ncbi:PPA1309 family protein [Umezawaea beigongshangensis]|uniref:PPA1309 family protein n=1 Tax=Umezawaea beigongshangensis TaxID=2780383 RepID=UPI0018F1F4A3|nr:PPA1309 family protein [Umezawaea beigongshangensis]
MSRVSASESPDKPIALLPAVAREVEEFVSSAGWDQAPQLFALVPTAELLTSQPELAGQLDPASTWTPIAQDELPADDLGEALAGIVWPDVVGGCALAQEIVVLPPEAEDEIPDDEQDDEAARRFAAEHPQRREARLVAAVLRDGTVACVLHLRGDAERPDEIVEHPELAPNLTDALLETFKP